MYANPQPKSDIRRQEETRKPAGEKPNQFLCS